MVAWASLFSPHYIVLTPTYEAHFNSGILLLRGTSFLDTIQATSKPSLMLDQAEFLDSLALVTASPEVQQLPPYLWFLFRVLLLAPVT